MGDMIGKGIWVKRETARQGKARKIKIRWAAPWSGTKEVSDRYGARIKRGAVPYGMGVGLEMGKSHDYIKDVGFAACLTVFSSLSRDHQ